LTYSENDVWKAIKKFSPEVLKYPMLFINK